MICLINDITDPAINHGIEEYFMKETNEEVFTLWQNNPTVLLGKNQDAYAEINIDYAEKEGINIVRRLSGGGTVYCDLKNMQYSFITNKDNVKIAHSFEKFARPIVSALQDLGLKAQFTGRNDILINNKKISGNAQYRHNNRILHHGTLLFDVDNEKLSNTINSRKIKFSNKKITSVISRIGKIIDFLPNMNIQEFMEYLINYTIKYYDIKKIISVNEEIIKRSEKYTFKFKDKNRNLGIKFNNTLQMSVKYDFGLIEYKILLEENKLKDIKILGDYFENKSIEEFLFYFKDINFDKENIKKQLSSINISEYIKGMNNKMLFEDLMKIKEGA